MATTDEATIEKAREMRAAGAKVTAIAEKLGMSKASVYKHTGDVAAAEKTAEGGGDGEGGDNDALLAWYEQREKELLELVEKLTKRLMNAMDTIEAQAAEAEG